VKGLGAFGECGAGWMFGPTFVGEGVLERTTGIHRRPACSTVVQGFTGVPPVPQRKRGERRGMRGKLGKFV